MTARCEVSGVSQSTPSGGTVITAEAGLPCQGSGTASIWPMLPTPLPPYTIASVLRTSRQRPARGRPTRYFRCGTAEKLAMHASTPEEVSSSPAAAAKRRKDSVLPRASLASIQVNPCCELSCSHSAGVCR